MLRQVAGARRCVPRLGGSQLLPASLPAAALSTSPAAPAKARQPTGRQVKDNGNFVKTFSKLR